MNEQSRPPRTSGMAIASLVLGILSISGLFMFVAPPILAVILGHLSVSECKKDPNVTGKGMGIAGLIMGWLCVALMIFFAVLIGIDLFGGDFIDSLIEAKINAEEMSNQPIE